MRRHRRAMSPRHLAVVASSFLAIATSGCGPSPNPESLAGPGDFGHVHEMVDHDDTILVATHTGLYRLDGSGRAVPVGEQRHDLMSLTRLATGDLAASGHPDLRLDDYRLEGLPPLLGLVLSDDEGETWQRVALLGEADFHALGPTTDGVYGVESSGLVWFFDADLTGEQRGVLEARDLAAEPQANGVVAAVGFDGTVLASADGARSWSVVETAPALIEIEWPEMDMLVGLDRAGAIWRASNVEGPWTRAADGPDNPEALLVTSSSWLVALDGGRIARSDNAGESWTDEYIPPAE